MIEFRKATAEDAPLLAATRQKAWAATYRGIYPDDVIDNFDYAWHTAREEKNLRDPSIHTYLIMDGKNCGGYFTFFIKDRPIWRDYRVRLFSLYLLPSLQGRGLGRKILESVKSECRSLGISKLYLSCNPQNTPAMSFYRHMGGRIVAEDTGHENPQEDTIELEFNC